MQYKQILKEMKESIGTRDPVEYFDKLTDCLSALFDEIEKLNESNYKFKQLTTLAIKWDPKVASELIIIETKKLSNNKEFYGDLINTLKEAYNANEVTQSYEEFCTFWQDTLGWHPFMEA
jgi:hypothetical protein